MPKWLKRLFYQRIECAPSTVFGQDIGFSGLAADVPITDDHQRVHLEGARTEKDRLHASYNYLRKVLKNGTNAAEERFDPETIATLNEACQRLAETIFVLTERLKTRMRERGYDDRASDEIEPVRSGSLTFLEATGEKGSTD